MMITLTVIGFLLMGFGPLVIFLSDEVPPTPGRASSGGPITYIFMGHEVTDLLGNYRSSVPPRKDPIPRSKLGTAIGSCMLFTGLIMLIFVGICAIT